MSLLMGKFKENLKKNKDKTLSEESKTFFAHKTGIDVFDFRNGKMLEDGDGKQYPSLGIDEGTYTMIVGRSGGGKAQPLYSDILTPNGWVKMGDIKVGSQVMCPISGKAIEVTEIHPQGIKENFKVTLSDGTSMECNDEHLFEVQYRCWDKVNKKSIMKTKVDTLKNIMTDYKSDSGKLKYYLPMTTSLEFGEKELLIHPYLLGVLLGDGNVTKTTPRITNTENDILEKVESLLPEGMEMVLEDKHTYRLVDRNKAENTLNEYLKHYNLQGKTSLEKNIPSDYMFTSSEDRLELLRGLIDTDGCIEKNGKCIYFYTSSEQLANDVKFLVQSLGGTAKIGKKEACYSTKNGEKVRVNDNYRTYIHLPESIIPFTSEKHGKRFQGRTKYNNPIRKIVSIEKIGETEMQCIRVNSERHLYMTNDCIVTHNTGTAIQIASNIIRPYENGLIYHFDIEQATELSRIKKITRMSTEEFKQKYILKNTGIYHETIMSIFNEMVHAKEELKDQLLIDTGKTDIHGEKIKIFPPTVFIIDSLAMLTSKEKATDDLEALAGNMTAAANAKANASFFRQIVPKLKDYNIHLIVINHIIDKIDINQYTAPKVRINYLGQNESTVGK